MTDDSVIPRRELLSSLATVGTIGVVSGAGTAALFTDHEAFVGNLLVAGELNLDVCWERHDDGTECTPDSDEARIDFGNIEQGDSGTASIRCLLRDNPGWVWLRSNCPPGPCGIGEAVEVTMWYDEGCDGDLNTNGNSMQEPYLRAADGTAIKDLRLCDALELLRDGVKLDGTPMHSTADPATALQPGEDCCIGFHWEVVDPICVDQDAFELTFEFHTEQRRHNPDPENPFPDVDCNVDCTTECPDCDFKSLSFISWCVDSATIDPGDITMKVYEDAEGEPYRVDWWVADDVDLETVTVYYGAAGCPGQYFENFTNPGTSGSAQAGEGDEKLYVPSGANNRDCQAQEIPDCADTDRLACENSQSPPSPCPPGECGLKYEFDENNWENTCDSGGKP